MKLSSKQALNVADFNRWQPQNLLAPVQPEPEEASVEEILAIFKGDLPRRTPAGLRGSSNLQYSSDSAFPAWAPADLPAALPNEDEVQKRDVKIPGSALSARANNNPALFQAMQAKVDRLLEEAHNTRTETMRLEEEAQLNAQTIIKNAEREVETRYQQAYEQGKALAEAELFSAIQAAQNLLNELDTWRSQLLTQSEPQVIGMVKDISKSLFGDGFVLPPQVLQDLYTNTLTRTRTMGNLRIFVNPTDAALIGPGWREYQTMVGGKNIQLIPTEDIKSGGCYVEGDQGSVDARIDTRLNAVLSVFDEETV
jgi:flagellar assembly protein FliH